jgi:serpin B
MPFAVGQTQEQEFYVPGAAPVKVPLMYQGDATLAYLDGGTFQAVEIPYKNRELAMVVLLPRERNGLSTLEASLTAGNLQQWQTQMAPARVNLSLPRFQMTQAFELGKTLAGMGMGEAFGGGADFSGMTGKRDLAISDVVHKAFVDVNEAGTEAAAATAVGMRALAMRQPMEPPVEFRADHPFVFLIRENRSRSILFLGRVVEPAR